MESLLYLQISETQMDRIRKIIIEILRESGAKCGLLIDNAGNLLIRKGFTLIREIDNLGALIAASRAITQAISDLLGQDEISLIFHQGSGDHIHSTDVGVMAILTLIFDDRADLTRIREVTLKWVPQLRRLLEDCDLDPETVRGSIQKLRADADKRLESVFGTSAPKPPATTPKDQEVA